MDYVIVEGEVTLADSDGNALSTVSGTSGNKLEVHSDIDSIIDDGSLKVKEQNLDSEGYIRNSAHNMGQYNGSWFPFSLDEAHRLRVVMETESLPHTLSGVLHIGALSDLQIPSNIVRQDQLLTTSGSLQYNIDYIDGGVFI